MTTLLESGPGSRMATGGSDAHRRVGALGRILGVWAHPDDETYLSGGLLTLARDNGQRTMCVTATAGELGTDDPAAWPPRRLAATRRRELRDCLGVLGVDEHAWLGHPDGGCRAVDAESATRRLVEIIERFRPDTVVTFGEDGITGHADHCAVGGWATAAARRHGRCAILHAAKPGDWVDHFAPLHGRLQVFEEGYPRPVRAEDLSLDLLLDDVVLEHKVNALRAQASQTVRVIDAFGLVSWRDWIRRESFVNAAGADAQRRNRRNGEVGVR